ncbi:putative disease resistance protein At3g15700 isoform X2 [Hibiscus syriacus]|uniref:putative disease resistance protein At3g15700 isoform X2 n=1 Tax=Hibiscus syriacus TaxID=106335 RepID=UPI0019242F7C|nr:putative disease resistance protein At3g15700 isoform X2 [Hibiscus syriacus]
MFPRSKLAPSFYLAFPPAFPSQKIFNPFSWSFFLHSQTELSGTGTHLYFYPKSVHFLEMGSAIKGFMELAEQVGSIFEVGNTIWGLIGDHWKPPRGIDRSVNNLKRKRDQLNGQKDDTTLRIRAELRPRKEVKKEVELWLENVNRIDREISNLESKVGASGFFSRGFLVKDVCKKGQEVDELIGRGGFSDALVVYDCSQIGCMLPASSLVVETIGLKRDEILRYLRTNDDVRKIGVYGMPGVGKTSVVKLVNNELLKDKIKFDSSMVTVSTKCVIELQDKIAGAMNVVIPEDEDETLRAGMLSEILSDKGKFALILDDVREIFSLEKVGIPEPSADNGSKIVLTTQSMDVCRRMDCRVIKVEPLPEADAWTLFSDKVGRSLMSSADLFPVARSIVDRCAGLPLVIVTVASTMRGEYSPPIWRNALEELNRNIPGITDVKNTIYRQLRFSYNRLNDPRIRNCLLSCASYGEDSGIRKEQLIRDWIGKGLIDDMDEGQAIVRTLVDNCLLENVGNERIKMHGLVRDMAQHIKHELYES